VQCKNYRCGRLSICSDFDNTVFVVFLLFCTTIPVPLYTSFVLDLSYFFIFYFGAYLSILTRFVAFLFVINHYRVLNERTYCSSTVANDVPRVLLVFIFYLFFVSVPCARLSWPFRQVIVLYCILLSDKCRQNGT